MSKARSRIAITVEEEMCKGCGLCVQACPHGAMGFADHMNSRGFHPACLLRPDECTGCAQCALMCPDVCIRIVRLR